MSADHFREQARLADATLAGNSIRRNGRRGSQLQRELRVISRSAQRSTRSGAQSRRSTTPFRVYAGRIPYATRRYFCKSRDGTLSTRPVPRADGTERLVFAQSITKPPRTGGCPTPLWSGRSPGARGPRRPRCRRRSEAGNNRRIDAAPARDRVSKQPRARRKFCAAREVAVATALG